jgi:hypothetical protein
VDVVQCNADDGVAAFGLLGDELVAELVVLQQLVGQCRDAVLLSVFDVRHSGVEQDDLPHDGRQAGPQLDPLHIRDVLLEELVYILLVLLQSRELGDVVHRYHAVHLGLAELDDALAQVAQVLQQVVVIRIDELPLSC